jgi:hypothetical protein
MISCDRTFAVFISRLPVSISCLPSASHEQAIREQENYSSHVTFSPVGESRHGFFSDFQQDSHPVSRLNSGS